jgi:hypothetical protein
MATAAFFCRSANRYKIIRYVGGSNSKVKIVASGETIPNPYPELKIVTCMYLHCNACYHAFCPRHVPFYPEIQSRGEEYSFDRPESGEQRRSLSW